MLTREPFTCPNCTERLHQRIVFLGSEFSYECPACRALHVFTENLHADFQDNFRVHGCSDSPWSASCCIGTLKRDGTWMATLPWTDRTVADRLNCLAEAVSKRPSPTPHGAGLIRDLLATDSGLEFRDIRGERIDAPHVAVLVHSDSRGRAGFGSTRQLGEACRAIAAKGLRPVIVACSPSEAAACAGMRSERVLVLLSPYDCRYLFNGDLTKPDSVVEIGIDPEAQTSVSLCAAAFDTWLDHVASLAASSEH